MNEHQRSQVRDNARYLQQVRPIDPEEICEYVDGTPHPAAVAQTLREEATDLGLRERPDGRFEPVEEGPLDVAFDGVEAVPEEISRAVEGLLVAQFGPDWPDGESGARLRAVIRDFKRRYLSGAPVTYDEVTALGYAIYHLPQSFAATQHVLATLAADDRLPTDLRVLDVGAGVGGPALGLDRLAAGALVEYHAVEPSAAASVLDELLAETGRNFHPTIHREPIEEFEPDGAYDLLVCANVLSELDDPAGQVTRLLDSLAPDGTLLALAPADRNTATHLREVESAVEREADATVYAPTIRLWSHETPESESWSFDRKPDLDVPAFQRRLDRGERSAEERGEADDTDEGSGSDDGAASKSDQGRQPGDGEFVNIDVQYAYSLLRTDGARAIEYRPDSGRVAKLAATERHVTDRIDCVAVKLSTNLAEEGNPLFLVGDGSQQIDHFAVLTESSMLNRDLDTTEYGTVLRFENALVLWNDDEQAYNLVVDGETVVDRIVGLPSA
jgi:SAM-dependent methyltransferase